MPYPKRAQSEGGKKSAEIQQTAAILAYEETTNEILSLRDKGLSLNQIAKALNEAGYTTRQGKSFTAMQVSRILKRVGKPTAPLAGVKEPVTSTIEQSEPSFFEAKFFELKDYIESAFEKVAGELEEKRGLHEAKGKKFNPHRDEPRRAVALGIWKALKEMVEVDSFVYAH